MYSVRLHKGLEHVPPTVVHCVNCPTRLCLESQPQPSKTFGRDLYTLEVLGPAPFTLQFTFLARHVHLYTIHPCHHHLHAPHPFHKSRGSLLLLPQWRSCRRRLCLQPHRRSVFLLRHRLQLSRKQDLCSFRRCALQPRKLHG
jgi:hypothetical protein